MTHSPHQPKLASGHKHKRPGERVFFIAPLAAKPRPENAHRYGGIASGATYVESDPIGLAGGSYSTYSYGSNNPISNIDPLGQAAQCGTPTLCQHRDWHNLKLAEKVAALQGAGYLVATNVAIRLLSANSSGFAVADYIATLPGSNVYQIGEVKTGNSVLSQRQLQNYGNGLVQIVGENGLPLGLEPGEFIQGYFIGVDRFPGCPP